MLLSIIPIIKMYISLVRQSSVGKHPFMASSLHSNLSFFPRSRSSSKTHPPTTLTIRCGPRDNRGPIQKGRILSTEAMQAIQALKRSRSDETKLNHLLSTALPRLLKADLVASLAELLRQDQCHLALKVFSAVRSEFWYKPDCGLYADVVLALARNGMAEEIDGVVAELEREGLEKKDCARISRLIKALVGAGKKEAVVRVYEAMRRGGWECVDETDEYVVKVLSRGLRLLGEGPVADEVLAQFGGGLSQEGN